MRYYHHVFLSHEAPAGHCFGALSGRHGNRLPGGPFTRDDGSIHP